VWIDARDRHWQAARRDRFAQRVKLADVSGEDFQFDRVATVIDGMHAVAAALGDQRPAWRQSRR
jgi:hypothetical protein